MSRSEEADIVVIGGGIAGASAAAHLAPEHHVVVIERESQPGYHASGRSAALFTETTGSAIVRGLAAAGRPFLAEPPPGFAEHPLLQPRGMLHVGGAEHAERLGRLHEEWRRLQPSVRRLARTEIRALVPVLRPEKIFGGVYEPTAMDIDTSALLHGFLRVARHHGAQLVTGAEVLGIDRGGPGFRVETTKGAFTAPILVNAAGAWCDAVAALAGLAPLGLRPLKRTAFLVAPPEGVDVGNWPMVTEAGDAFYFKPDAGMILASPADEIPTEPSDAQADEYDIAVAVEAIEAMADLAIRRVAHRWAGLRTFAPDRNPVAGFDPRLPRFFWLAGQGGYGFKTSPALGEATAALVAGRALPEALEARGVTAEALAPGRFLQSAVA